MTRKLCLLPYKTPVFGALEHRRSQFQETDFFILFLEVPGGFEPPNTGFADPGLTTWRRYQE